MECKEGRPKVRDSVARACRLAFVAGILMVAISGCSSLRPATEYPRTASFALENPGQASLFLPGIGFGRDIFDVRFPVGLGGGGAGSPAGTTGVNGTANTGGGGGGSVSGGGNGGSGIVIIRYLTGSVTATGGTVSTDGNYTIHTFTSSGLFEVAPDYVPEFGSWALLLALGIVAAGIIGVRAKN